MQSQHSSHLFHRRIAQHLHKLVFGGCGLVSVALDVIGAVIVVCVVHVVGVVIMAVIVNLPKVLIYNIYLNIFRHVFCLDMTFFLTTTFVIIIFCTVSRG